MSRVGCLQDRRKPYLIDGIGGYDLYNYNKGQLQNSYFLEFCRIFQTSKSQNKISDDSVQEELG